MNATDGSNPTPGAASSQATSAQSPATSALIERFGWKRVVPAIGVAAVSDVLSAVFTLVPPVQVGIDIVTAGLIFAILGRQPLLLVPLVLEAIPGVGMVPFWLLVVVPLSLFGKVPGRGRNQQPSQIRP